MHLHRSPGLTAVYNASNGRNNNRILDLGPSKSSAFRFFSELSSKIIFEGLDEFIVEKGHLPAESFAEELKDYCLPKRADEKFDVVLAWDYFNYLPFANVIKLMEVLRPWCKPDTLIFAIRYAGNSVPSAPPTFEIRDKHHLKVDRFKIAPRQYPNGTTAQFLKHAEDFEIEGTIGQKEGMLPGFTEQLIRFQPSRKSNRQFNTIAELKQTAHTVVDENALLHHSPSLKQLDQKTSYTSILDLGKRSPTNMEVWRNSFSDVFFEDLVSSMQWQNKPGHAASLSGLSPNMLQFNDKRFDVIATWDILNFCNEEQLASLAHKLRSLAHENTVIMVMLYTGSTLPKRPAKFWLNQNQSMHIEAVESHKRTSARLTVTGLMRYFGGAKMIGTYAFEEGMQSEIREFLFTVTPLSAEEAQAGNGQKRSVNGGDVGV